MMIAHPFLPVILHLLLASLPLFGIGLLPVIDNRCRREIRYEKSFHGHDYLLRSLIDPVGSRAQDQDDCPTEPGHPPQYRRPLPWPARLSANRAWPGLMSWSRVRLGRLLFA